MLELIQVQKTYGARRILDIPDFRLENGLYWLQGLNGVGKTTLLRIIAGILRFSDRLGIGAWLGTRAATWSSGMTKAPT